MSEKPPPLNADAQRQAVPPIRGYAYQIWQTLLHWITLSDEQALYIERAEDFDIAGPTKDDVIQVAHVKGPKAVTLRTPKVVEAIRTFWTHQGRNPDREVHMHFLTTAHRGLERPPITRGSSGLDYWDKCGSNAQLSVEPLRTYLSEQRVLQIELRRFAGTASEAELRSQLLGRIHWATEQGASDSIRKQVADTLVTIADRWSVMPSVAVSAATKLCDFVWQAAYRDGERRLTRADFLIEFEDAVTTKVPHTWGLLAKAGSPGRSPYGSSDDAPSAGPSIAVRDYGSPEPVRAINGSPTTRRTARPHRREVTLLTYSQRRILGLIATAPFPFTEAQLREILPLSISHREIRFLVRRRLLKSYRGRLQAVPTARQATTADKREVVELDRIWVEAFTPLKSNVDVAVFLAQKLLALGELGQAVTVLTNIAENLDPGHWNHAYAQMLVAFHSENKVRHLDAQTRLHFYNALGLCLSRDGEPDQAITWFKQLRSLAVRLKSAWALGQAYIHLGLAHHEVGDDCAASRFYRNGVEHGRATGDHLLMGRCLHNLAMIAADSDLDAAERLLSESIRHKTRARDVQGMIAAYLGLGSLAVGRRNFARARTYFVKAERRARSMHRHHARTTALVNSASATIDLVRAEARDSTLTNSQKQRVREALVTYRAAASIADQEGYAKLKILAIQGEAIGATLVGAYGSAEDLFLSLHCLKSYLGDTEGAISALHDAGVSAIQDGRVPRGRRSVGRALQLAQQASSTDWVVKCHLTIAASHTSSTRTRNSLHAAADEELRACRNDVAGRLWKALALFELQSGHWDAVEASLLEGASALTRRKDTAQEVLALYKLLFQLSRGQGRIPQSLAALVRIQTVAERQGDRLELARASDERGVLLQELNQFEIAEQAHRRSLGIARTHGYEAQRAISLNNLGELLRKTSRPHDAIRAYREAEQVSRSLHDRESEFSTAHNRALALDDLGRLRQATALLSRIERETARHGFLDEHVRALHGRGNLAWRAGKRTLAIQKLQAVLRQARKAKLSSQEVAISANLAHFLRILGRTREAIPILRAVEATVSPDQRIAKRLLALSFEDATDWSSARSTWQQLIALAEIAGDDSALAEASAAVARIKRRTNPSATTARLANAIKAERNPKARAMLLSEHTQFLLDVNREPEAEHLFKEACALANEHNLEDVLIDIHMALGDYYWSQGAHRQLEAVQCYIAGMVSAVERVDLFSKMGAHIFDRVFAVTGSDRLRRIGRLRSGLDRWLAPHWRAAKHSSNVDETRSLILWPVILAERLARKHMSPYRWSSAQARALFDREVAQVFGSDPDSPSRRGDGGSREQRAP